VWGVMLENSTRILQKQRNAWAGGGELMGLRAENASAKGAVET